MPSPVVIMPGRMVGEVRSPGCCGISRFVVAIMPDALEPAATEPRRPAGKAGVTQAVFGFARKNAHPAVLAELVAQHPGQVDAGDGPDLLAGVEQAGAEAVVAAALAAAAATATTLPRGQVDPGTTGSGTTGSDTKSPVASAKRKPAAAKETP